DDEDLLGPGLLGQLARGDAFHIRVGHDGDVIRVDQVGFGGQLVAVAGDVDEQDLRLLRDRAGRLAGAAGDLSDQGHHVVLQDQLPDVGDRPVAGGAVVDHVHLDL